MTIKPPKDLGADERKKWREITSPEVWGKEIKPQDADMLAEYCRLHVRKLHAEKMAQETGEVVELPNGTLAHSPWVRIADKCRSDMLTIARDFGGTPAARMRIQKNLASAGGKKAAQKKAVEQSRFTVPEAPAAVVRH